LFGNVTYPSLKVNYTYINFQLTFSKNRQARQIKPGRSRQAADLYIADLRATTLLELDLKIFCLSPLGIPQDRIAKILGIPQKTISRYLAKMPILAFWLNRLRIYRKSNISP